MASRKFEGKPQQGDLIEISRGAYQHWAIYVGDGYIIHLAPPSEQAQAGAYSLMSVMYDKAIVKKEQLGDVVGDDEYVVHNLLDDKYEPRPIHIILREAHSLLGQEQPYCVFSRNCEHFVTELRYGKAESRQVRDAVTVGVGVGVAALVVAGIVHLAAAFFDSDKKEKNKQ